MPDALRQFKANIFQALSHPTRIAIVEQLRDGELAAGEIIERLGLEQANASQHFAVLRAKNIVTTPQRRQSGVLLGARSAPARSARYSAPLFPGAYRRVPVHAQRDWNRTRRHQSEYLPAQRENNKLTPKLLLCLKNYTAQDFTADLIAGLTVGLVALPLAMAFGIASGVTPQAGIYTAVVAGFIISALGGSRTQIGGPTGAFVVIVAGIIAKFGLSGLLMVTLMAGVILVVMGVTGLGTAVKFIPRPVTIGFTNGIALLIASTQIKDFLGLQTPPVPSEFLGTHGSAWQASRHNASADVAGRLGVAGRHSAHAAPDQENSRLHCGAAARHGGRRAPASAHRHHRQQVRRHSAGASAVRYPAVSRRSYRAAAAFGA